MFGLFKKKDPATAMDQFIRMMYGDPPPAKRADVELAVSLVYEDLLAQSIEEDEILRIATDLSNGPIPYSTHDLALAVALHFYTKIPVGDRQNLLVPALEARMMALRWAKEGSVAPLLLQTFENTLYEQYPPVPEEDHRMLEGSFGDETFANAVKNLEEATGFAIAGTQFHLELKKYYFSLTKGKSFSKEAGAAMVLLIYAIETCRAMYDAAENGVYPPELTMRFSGIPSVKQLIGTLESVAPDRDEYDRHVGLALKRQYNDAWQRLEQQSEAGTA
jgi:hypothetical protein